MNTKLVKPHNKQCLPTDNKFGKIPVQIGAIKIVYWTLHFLIAKTRDI